MPLTADPHTTTRTVRRQYETFPYPLRNPDDERTRLVVTSLDELGALNYHCFGGRRDFRKGFRALVAGGGTGDAVVYLAHQLRRTDATIVYLDLSQPSMDVARKRIQVRGVGSRVRWVQGSLLELPGMGLEPFDYVNCSGVLHHLADPQAGLQALRSVLKPDGAMGLMVYGQYGRTGVYQMQELMRLVNRGEDDPAAQVDHTKAMLRSLPPTNWFKRGSGLFGVSQNPNDPEVYDMFLHSQDRAYTVPQLYDFLKSAGLNLANYALEYRALYDPTLLVGDQELRSRLAQLPRSEREAAAEIISGAITKHCFWATPATPTTPDLSDPDFIPFFPRIAQHGAIRDSILRTESGAWRFELKMLDGIVVALSFEVVPAVRRFVELIDNRRTMGEIVAAIADDYDPRPALEEVWRVCRHVFGVLAKADLLLLRHTSTPSLDVQ